MEATAEMMQRRPLRELRVAEIGTLAAVSSSTFYLYFESVAEAGLAVIEGLNQATPEVIELLDSQWNRENVLKKAKVFVQAYVNFWDRHHALLRVRNFAADEGDKRFFDARRRSVEPIHLGLQAKIVAFQRRYPDAPQLDPASTASVLLSMLERVAGVVRLPSAHKATRPRQLEATAYLFACAMIGSIADPEGGPNGRPSRRRANQPEPQLA